LRLRHFFGSITKPKPLICRIFLSDFIGFVDGFRASRGFSDKDSDPYNHCVNSASRSARQ